MALENKNIAADLPVQENLLTNLNRERYQWLVNLTPKTDHYHFPGGTITYSLFKASRYCFIYGHFLAALVLGLSFVEKTLQALFAKTDDASSQNNQLYILNKKAQTTGLIDNMVSQWIEHALTLKASFPHLDINEDKNQGIKQHHYTKIEIQEEDARQMMRVMIGLLKLKDDYNKKHN